MRSAVSICNKGLQFVGGSPISSLEEKTRGAELCSYLYEEVRDELLEAHHWSFATRYERLPKLPDSPPFGFEWDELWCVVTRNVNGAVCRYVERLAPYSMDGIEEQFFVDSGVSYRGEKTATFSGLDHLEGKSIQILADGFVIPPQVVSEGRIILPYAASVVHAGLQYSSELIPTEQDVMLKSGSSRGRTRRVNRMCLHLYESSGVQVGVGNVEPLPVLLGDGAVLDATPALFSGETVVEVNGGYEMQSNVLFRQEEPLPFTLLSYSMQVEIGER